MTLSKPNGFLLALPFLAALALALLVPDVALAQGLSKATSVAESFLNDIRPLLIVIAILGLIYVAVQWLITKRMDGMEALTWALACVVIGSAREITALFLS